MRISKNFTLEEVIKSNTAKRLGIDNTPNEIILDNLKVLVERIAQPTRDFMGRSITINSGYRCYKLNKAIGGAKYSDHMEGRALDLDCHSVELNKKMFDFIKDNLEFDKLIWEYGGKWVHVSYGNGNRKKIFSIG